MSATDQMRAMLDQLMGTARAGETGKRTNYHFSDDKVCKSFLLECCPHEILAATRMEIGECPKVHDLALRADYQIAAKSKEYYYELDALEHLNVFVADSDRRTEMAKRRLAETQEELSTDASEKLNKVHELVEQIGKKLAAAEAAGSEGNVEESLRLMDEVEQLKKEKSLAETDYRNSIPTSSYQQQKLRVCEVCSAFLGIQDNFDRLASHFSGKLHLGYISIREKLDELKELVEERRKNGTYDRRNEQDQKDGPSSRSSRDRDRDRRERKDRRSPSRRSRSRSPRRDRDRRDRDRDRDRSRRDGRRDQESRYRERDNSGYYRNGSSSRY